ncbi:PTS system sorbose subfamily IIB component [Brachyspira pilosicoli WesB]|uniref:PTS system sorbose subfamily IIB component n=1 Tax=Brachyspira pilosicoli WesB TaxID=1161918 RepID=K0JIJ3_BRAPL|nr:PTS sugar transporter subunit IIB [Brachyspira pilosicoli]CCG56739.1 PTS system sorbose subfamily IIB component [Brachyspira pilosicoli WesB]
MNISVFRIDERLIHGQIVTAWIADAQASQIIVADDKAVNDEFTISLLQLATPKNIELRILSINDAINLIKEDSSDKNTLLICRGPKEALQLIDGDIGLKTINVGNIGMRKGKKSILPYIWVDDEEVKNLKLLSERGIALDARSVPSDKSQNIIDLL